MPSLRDIKKRIQSVKNTGKITKAMKMVAASKLRKAQDNMLKLRPYSDKMASILSSLASGVEREAHPLLFVRPRETVEVVVLTTDKGLCGAFNTNIIKEAARLIKQRRSEGFKVSVTTVGKKARDFSRRRDVPLRKSWVGFSGKVTYAGAQEVARDIIDAYIDEQIDEVFLVYNEFRSVIVQAPTLKKLLPIEALGEEDQAISRGDFIFEPSSAEILNRLLPKNIEIQIFRALLESQASEEAARMTAMENATKNTNEMIDSLTLQYNKARQASITKELMDIVGGAAAIQQ
jgi:F-type H+-transporting ATPase subunit gamma